MLFPPRQKKYTERDTGFPLFHVDSTILKQQQKEKTKYTEGGNSLRAQRNKRS